MDIITLALARKFTKDTVNGLGAQKGAPCTVKSILEDGSDTVVTFSWTGADGSEQTSDLRIRNGNGIENITIDEEGSQLFTMTDGDVINAGNIGGYGCNPETCECLNERIANDDDVEPLLKEIGLYDVADYALQDELNNPLTDADGVRLVE